MTREEAIKILSREKECVQQALQRCADGSGYVSPDGMIRAADYVEACSVALAALRAQQEPEDPKPLTLGWISVKERLPEPEKTVLIQCRSQSSQWKYVCCGFYVPEGTYREDSGYTWDFECCDKYDEEKDDYQVRSGWYEAIHNWDDYNAVGVSDIVTHWMPLPEPPKEEV